MGFEDDLRRAEEHVAEALPRGDPAEGSHNPLKGGSVHDDNFIAVAVVLLHLADLPACVTASITASLSRRSCELERNRNRDDCDSSLYLPSLISCMRAKIRLQRSLLVRFSVSFFTYVSCSCGV